MTHHPRRAQDAAAADRQAAVQGRRDGGKCRAAAGRGEGALQAVPAPRWQRRHGGGAPSGQACCARRGSVKLPLCSLPFVMKLTTSFPINCTPCGHFATCTPAHITFDRRRGAPTLGMRHPGPKPPSRPPGQPHSTRACIDPVSSRGTGYALHGVEERHCLRLPAPCWHRRRASAGAGPRGRTSASGRYRVDARAGEVRLAWRPARRRRARMAHTKG